ncbi:ECM32 (YER176W) [Zygosaccharomyces parabailii]|nr:ECM32 (YER176W) [Zygosaccharomyces parabailii]CDH09479.1 related to Putative ATP-dependent RNA helicase ECM32 [Zygosaccharomyces bailii ISA1307]
MSKFQCTTCAEVLDTDAMMKHLSSSRHKTVIDAYSEEEIYCEECQNNNVHQLQIVRFGGEDMSLLCNTCLNKEYADSERPTTAYSLSNGSLLKFWDVYLKIRNCCCEICGNESHLNVNAKKKVVCDECLKKPGFEAKSFISEDSGRFLYLFLGIKETGNTKDIRKKGGRRLGRGKKGKGAGRPKNPREKNPREKKPLTVHQQLAQKAYENKKSNSAIEGDSSLSLKSFKGHKAASGVDQAKETKARIKPGSKTIGKNVKPGRGPLNAGKSRPPIKSTASQQKAASNGYSFEKSGKQTAKHVPGQVPKQKGPVNGTKSSRGPIDSRNSKPPRTKSADSSLKSGGRPKTQRENGSRTKSSPAEGSKSKKVAQKAKPSDKNKKTEAPERRNSNVLEKENAQSVEFEEGEPVTKLENYIPKLVYSDPDDYFNTYSYALFLEEKLENKFLQNFQITWPKSDKESVFVVKMDTENNPELEKLMPKSAAKLGRPPFVNLQPLILATQDESSVWYTYVKEFQMGRRNITLLLELYPWNKIKLPVRRSNDQVKILPCGAQTSRIYFAMTRAKNPRFIDLIMGQKPIKQISFLNRLTYSKDTFNESQKSAIQHVLNNNVTVLQGPPGTGKTSTIEEMITQMIRNFSSFPILVVAASNIAIDNIAEKFIDNKDGIRILRIVSDSKESQYNKDHPLGKICLHNIVNDQLPPQLREAQIKLRTGRSHDVSKTQNSNLFIAQNQIADRHIMQAQILFTTTITAGGRRLKAIQELPVVIMDESTQSSEAATLVPLSLPGIRKFVFVGDEKQLSSFSQIPQLEMSLFERVLLNGCYKNPHMLDTQYRMHPAISEFPRLRFYGGSLKDGVTDKDKSWPGVSYPLYFLRCEAGSENKVSSSQRGMRGYTYINRHECDALLQVLYKLILDKKVARDQIGIVTPYSAQRDLISEILVNDNVVNPEGHAMEQDVDEADVFDATGGKKNSINIVNGLFVATVDSFQGHEKNFILFSTVRNNKENKIGFVSDARRMNVALTRAKNGLVLIGSDKTLQAGSPLWNDYISYLSDKNLIFEDLGGY